MRSGDQTYRALWPCGVTCLTSLLHLLPHSFAHLLGLPRDIDDARRTSSILTIPLACPETSASYSFTTNATIASSMHHRSTTART
jgi:hypothetical protein